MPKNEMNPRPKYKKLNKQKITQHPQSANIRRRIQKKHVDPITDHNLNVNLANKQKIKNQ